MFSNKKKLYLILSFLVLLTSLTYYNRFPTGDDAWFAEQSYWLQKDGIIRSEFFRGILGWEKQLLVSHKLFLGFGAVLIKLFGFGLPTVQFVGFIFFCIIILEIIFYIKKEKDVQTNYYLLLVLILVFSNRLLIKMSFENRPELMLSALGFGSFLYINSNRQRLSKSAIAGFLAALAMLAHLNGIIYLIAGFGTYLVKRGYKQAILFAVVGGLTASTYFIDVLSAKDGLSTWYYQFRHDPATQNAFGWYSKLIVIVTFPKLFFESPEQAALSILFIYILWSQRNFLNNINITLKTYSTLLLLSFWLITKHGSGTYMPLFMPFMFTIIYELYKVRPFINWQLKLVMAIYFIIGIYGTLEIIYQNTLLGNFPDAYKKLRNHIPAHTTGLVPLTFFFNEYEQYSHLLCHENFTYYKIGNQNPANALAKWAFEHKSDFILMDYKYRNEYFYPKPGTPILPFYKLTFFDGRFAVYQRQ